MTSAPTSPTATPFVVQSDIVVPLSGAEHLEQAFRDRLRLVEQQPGFGQLEVWRDLNDPTRYVMASWWASEQEFRAYMRSNEHRVSHGRTPGGPDRPRPAGVRRFTRIAT